MRVTLRPPGHWFEYALVRAWAQPGERGNGRPLTSSHGWTSAKCIREPNAYSNLGHGMWWNVVESNAALSPTVIHRKPARRHLKGCAEGRTPEEPSRGEQMEHREGSA